MFLRMKTCLEKYADTRFFWSLYRVFYLQLPEDVDDVILSLAVCFSPQAVY